MSWFARFLEWFRSAPKPAPTPAPPPQPAMKFTSQVMPIEPFSPTNLAAMHNAERKKAGLTPLLVDSRLNIEAQARASHAAAVGLQAPHLHDGFAPDPGDVQDGENAAMGQADAASVMGDWMSSPGHRANILRREFTRIGLGRATSPDLVTYWYARFAR